MKIANGRFPFVLLCLLFQRLWNHDLMAEEIIFSKFASGHEQLNVTKQGRKETSGGDKITTEGGLTMIRGSYSTDTYLMVKKTRDREDAVLWRKEVSHPIIKGGTNPRLNRFLVLDVLQDGEQLAILYVDGSKIKMDIFDDTIAGDAKSWKSVTIFEESQVSGGRDIKKASITFSKNNIFVFWVSEDDKAELWEISKKSEVRLLWAQK